ncbi:MAG TPA: TonB-dependent receptor [Gemmatimonadales bacterium]
MMRSARLLAAVLGLLAGIQPLQAQQGEVGGVVVDSKTGQPLVRVQVVTEGGIGSTTDNRGRFRIGNLTGTQVAVNVALIGYRPLRATLNVGNLEARLELSEMAVNLGEIVVTGTVAGAEKRTLGNSISTVRAAEVQELAPSLDMSNLINSRAPGVVVIPGTGQVGSAPRIKIRGTNSFSLSDQPLIYIDGVRVANDVATGISVQGFGSGIAGRLNDIDPDNIESIEILKGPAASTLYGTEAANGVVQIITKRGRIGDRPEIKFGARFGTQWFMNPEGRIVEPVDKVNGVLTSWNPVTSEESFGNKLFKNGFGQGYSLSIGGGQQAYNYYAGVTYDYDKGIEPTNSAKRITGTVNLGITPGSTYDIQTSLSFVKSDVQQAFEAGAGGIWFSTIFGDPKLVDTPYRGFLFGPPEYQWGSRQPSQKINRYTASVTVNHRPASWFSHRLVVGLDQTDEGSEQLNRYLPPEWVQFNPGTAALGLKYSQKRTIQYNTFDYNASARADLTSSWKSTTSVGGQIYRRRTDLVWAQGDQFPAPDLETIAATAVRIGYDDYVENTTVGVFGQQQFGYKDRLYVTAALRVDNNSAFGEDFSFVAYPKVSSSYVWTEGAAGWLNTLKLRAAYGQSGQQPEAFAALRSYAPVTGGDGGPAVIPSFVGNPDLAPERSSEIEAGFEAGLFGDRVAVDFTYYYQNTKDAILLLPVAPSTGFPGNQYTNIGAIRNHGFEIQVNGQAVNSDNFGLNLNVSASHNTNEVTDLGEGVTTLGTFGPKLGYPVDAVFRRKVVSAELNEQGRAINIQCDDDKGGSTPNCATAPAVYLGVFDPRWEGAFSATATLWKRLRIYGLMDFKLGNKHIDNNRRALCQVFLRCDENFNPQNYDPLMIAEIQLNNVAQSWVTNDAGFLKLRELSANYMVPRSIAGFLGGRDATIGITARNLATITNWSGLDPESYFVTQLFTRLEQDNTPQLASVMFNLNISF